jgi:hypothetical protein
MKLIRTILALTVLIWIGNAASVQGARSPILTDQPVLSIPQSVPEGGSCGLMLLMALVGVGGLSGLTPKKQSPVA